MSQMFAIMGMGGWEMVLIGVATLLLFGPKKLPELARGLGKGIREFKKASSEVTDELQRAVDEPPAPPHKYPMEDSEPDHSVPHSTTPSVSRDNPPK